MRYEREARDVTSPALRQSDFQTHLFLDYPNDGVEWSCVRTFMALASEYICFTGWNNILSHNESVHSPLPAPTQITAIAMAPAHALL